MTRAGEHITTEILAMMAVEIHTMTVRMEIGKVKGDLMKTVVQNLV